MWHRTGLLALSIGLCTGAVAEQQACANPTTTAEIAECSSESSKRAERQMNAVYDRVRCKASRIVDASGKRVDLGPGVAQSQARWAAYRKSVCELEERRTLLGNPSRGGPAAISGLACMQRLAEERTKELAYFEKEYLEREVCHITGRSIGRPSAAAELQR
jgi:uncharacterized protein YecT (DUF1311 family)